LSDLADRTGQFIIAIRQRGIVPDWSVCRKRKVCEGEERREDVFTSRAQFFHMLQLYARGALHDDSKGNFTNILQAQPWFAADSKK
jgi:hypothetical protein